MHSCHICLDAKVATYAAPTFLTQQECRLLGPLPTSPERRMFSEDGVGLGSIGPGGVFSRGPAAAAPSDMDVFGHKLAAIVAADFTALALSAGPLDIAGQVIFE